MPTDDEEPVDDAGDVADDDGMTALLEDAPAVEEETPALLGSRDAALLAGWIPEVLLPADDVVVLPADVAPDVTEVPELVLREVPLDATWCEDPVEDTLPTSAAVPPSSLVEPGGGQPLTSKSIISGATVYVLINNLRAAA